MAEGSIIIPRRARPSWSAGFARSQSDARFPSLWDSLVGHWVPSLGATGGTLFDVSGRQNNGEVIGATWDSTGALSFDDVDDEVSLPATPLFTLLPQLSIVARIRHVRFFHGGGGVVMTLGASAFGNWSFAMVTGGDLQFISDWSISDVGARSVSVVAIDTWYNVAMTWNGGNNSSGIDVKLYVDGIQVELDSTSSGGTRKNESALQLSICSAAKGDVHIASEALYRRILSPSEIQLIHERSLAGYNAILERKSRVLPVATAAPPAAGNPWNYYAQQAALVG